METEHKETIEKLTAETKALAKENARERARISDEHSAALARQRKELTETAEQTENRLMLLLDKERQEAKASRGELTGQLDELRDRVQIHREKNIELETAIRQLTEKNGGLEAELTAAQSEASDLSQALQQEKQRAEALRRDFDAYKDKHKISGDLGELKAVVDALQARLKKDGAE